MTSYWVKLTSFLHCWSRRKRDYTCGRFQLVFKKQFGGFTWVWLVQTKVGARYGRWTTSFL
jgi:hypothetical protein